MGRSPCCSKEGLNRGAWTAQEDKILTEYIKAHGEGGWRNLPKKAGLKRCGKSCRLRWLNYLRPDIKRGNISPDEEELIIRLHKLLGNRWSLIAGRLPGRTDNEIKNYWNTNLGKKVQDHQPKNTGNGGDDGKRKLDAKAFPCGVAMASVSPSRPESLVIRTKALKCSKVVVHHPQANAHANSGNGGGTSAAKSSTEDAPAVPVCCADGSLPAAAAEDHHQPDLGMDFNAAEFCLSNLLGSEFSEMHDFANSNDLSPTSDQTPTFSGDLLGDWAAADCVQPSVASNLHSFSYLLDSVGEWLED